MARLEFELLRGKERSDFAMSFWDKILNDDEPVNPRSPATPAPSPAPAPKAPVKVKPAKAELTDEQRAALRELGRKGGKARAAKRAAIKANTPAAALAKSGDASDPPKV